MSTPIFPTLSPAWGIKRSPITSTTVQRSANQFRTAYQNMQFARWRFKLQFLSLSSASGLQSDLASLMGFFATAGGQYAPFLYSPKDFSSVTGQSLTRLEDDDGNWFSPIRVSLGGYSDLITDLNGAAVVKANGVTKTLGVDYIIQTGASSSAWSEPGLVIAWTGTPTAPVTANFSWYYRCAFTHDDQEFEWFINNYWKASLEWESEFDAA